MSRRSDPKPKRPFLSRTVHECGRVYWQIRSGDRGEIRYGRRVRPAYKVLVNLGRVPTDPHKRKAFFINARLALLRYGIVEPIKKGIKAVRHQPLETRRRFYAPPPGLPSIGGESSCPTADHQGLGSSRVDEADRTGWARHGNPNPKKRPK